MTNEPEVRALMAVVDRLAERFPEEQRSVIEDVVAEEHRFLDDGPIRDYVPVLVERAARLRLAERFPEEQRSVIEDVVAEEHRFLDDGPIRDYVPVLVERAARLRLAQH